MVVVRHGREARTLALGGAEALPIGEVSIIMIAAGLARAELVFKRGPGGIGVHVHGGRPAAGHRRCVREQSRSGERRGGTHGEAVKADARHGTW